MKVNTWNDDDSEIVKVNAWNDDDSEIVKVNAWNDDDSEIVKVNAWNNDNSEGFSCSLRVWYLFYAPVGIDEMQGSLC